MADWTPTGEGAAFEYSRVMKPLEAFRKDTVVLSGLAHRNGMALGDGPGDHARAAASYLTGVHPRKTAGADIQNGISVDQIAAQHDRRRRPASRRSSSAATTRAPSATATRATPARIPTAWRGADRPRRCRRRPIRAWCSSGCSATSTPACRRRPAPAGCAIAAASWIWSASAPPSWSTDLGPADRRKLDEYLSSIREIEQRIERAEQRHDRADADHRQADRHPGAVRRLRQPDVRPAAHRVPDRHDPRRHA